MQKTEPLVAASFMLVSSFAYFSTLKMKKIFSSETSADSPHYTSPYQKIKLVRFINRLVYVYLTTLYQFLVLYSIEEKTTGLK